MVGLEESVTFEIDSVAICRRDGHLSGNETNLGKCNTFLTSGSLEDSTVVTSEIFADSMQ